MSDEEGSFSDGGQKELEADFSEQQEVREEHSKQSSGMPMVEFLQRLTKRFKVLRCIPPQQRELFELEVVKLLVDEDQQVDMANFELLTKEGLEAFVLEVLAVVQKESQAQAKAADSVLDQDLQDINRIVEEKLSSLRKREKVVGEKEARVKSLQDSLMGLIKKKAQALQKEIIEAMGRRESDLTKRLNNKTRELKIKADILKDKVTEMSQLGDRIAKIQAQEKSLKERIKTLERREELLRKKQAEMHKMELQAGKSIDEGVQLKLRLKEQENKLSQLNGIVQEKTKLLWSREEQLSRCKATSAELQLRVERLEQALQSSKKALKQRLKEKPSPVKLLEDELNISEIAAQHEQSFVSRYQQQPVEQTQHPHSSVSHQHCLKLIETLLSHIPQDTNFSKECKISMLAIFHINAKADCPRIQQLILKWLMKEPLAGMIHCNSLPLQKGSLHSRLIMLLSAPVGLDSCRLIDNISVDLDEQKQELIFRGYLQHIIKEIGLKHLPNQSLNCSLVLLMLRCVEHSPLYQRIIRELSKQPCVDYMQTLFEKYQMEDQIIENLSVLLSRCCLSGSLQLRPSFLQSLKRKIKVLPNDLPKRNLQSVLDSLK